MITKYILAGLAVVFLIAFMFSPRKAWIIIAIIFGAVSAWLWFK